MKIVIPGMIPPSPNVLRRKYRNPHAYARMRDKWQEAIFVLTPQVDRKMLQSRAANNRMIVQMSMYTQREYDPDNLAGSQKPILDALKFLGFIHDDSSEWLSLLPPQWHRASKYICTEIYIAEDGGAA